MRLIYKTILIIFLCVVIQDVESGDQEGKNGGLNRTKTSALPVDVTLYQGYPILFDASSDSLAEFRAYVSNPLNDLVYNIGRRSDTGPGDVVEKIENPPAGIINNPALPANSEINYVITPTHQRMDVRLFGTVEPKERSGAFYVEAVQGGVTEKLTTVKTSRQATVKFLQSTLTTSIGDDISLEVNTSLPSSVLRWQHNNEPISLWDGLEKVTIRDVRKADEGIYECYEDGQREEGIHGIMNLIVRKCPKQKYGLICENVCETCYNGGSCRDDTGVCVCPPGFKGTNCEESCGSNHWGATCSMQCSSQEDGDCFGNLFCPPRPAQCSCIAGYSGEMCDIACTGNKFGPNCAFTCHCHECNNVKGCTGECDGGYGGDFELCQEPPVCPDGKFGKVCEFDCHCKDDVDCDRISGICLNHECAVGWGNSDCQHALPAFYHAPVPSADHVTGSISVSWDHWTQNTDYGTPPTDGFWFHYGEGALTTSKRSYQTTEILSDVHRGSEYVFAVAVVGIDNTPGALSPTASARVECIKPSQSPTITSVTMGTEAAVITWTIPNNVDDWIGCKSGVQSFTIYSDVFPAKIVNGNQRSDTISGLLPCSVYEFSITVDNADHSSYLSAPVSGNTDNEVPEKVSALTITNPTTTSLDVTWQEPSIPSPCSVSGYSVSFRLTELDQCDPTNGPIENIDTPSTVVVIDGLRSHSTYEVSVAAYSGSVYGEAVTTSAKTSESTPSAEPANIVSDNSVKNRLAFTWDPPPCGSRNGEIKQYDYVFGLDVDIGEPIRGSTGPDDRFVSFDELEHYTKYEFQVRAATSPGPGLYSDVLSVTTAESNPEGPPRNLSPEAKWIEPDQVGYSWDPPSEDLQNGRISGYSYEFNTYPESSDEEWPRTGEVSDTNIIFTDLQEDTPYQVRVRAKTSAGVGPWSGFVTATTSAHPISESPPKTSPSGLSTPSGASSFSSSVFIFVLLPIVLFVSASLVVDQ